LLMLGHNLPFRPIAGSMTAEGWRYWCPALDRSTGRCTIYDNRPELCRSYNAGRDNLCIHHLSREFGEAEAA
jgi:Fe-S-cluster containining protein